MVSWMVSWVLILNTELVFNAQPSTNPVTPRSDICSNCFKKYCYDPENPPPEGQIVGRRFKFKDPDPFGIKSFYLAHKAGVIIAAIIVGLGLIATITGCVMFWRRRFQRRKTRDVAYQRLSEGNGSEWSAHMRQESYDVTPPRYSVLVYEKAEWQHSGPSYEMAKADYTEPSYHSAAAYYAGSGYETVKLHYAEPSNETPPATAHCAGPSDETSELHHAEPSYETATTHYTEPKYYSAATYYAGSGYETTKLHYGELSNETPLATAHYAGPSDETSEPHHAEPSYYSERRN